MFNNVRPQHPGMLYRELGATGEMVSAIGMGGFHIGKTFETTEQSIELIRFGINAGRNQLARFTFALHDQNNI